MKKKDTIRTSDEIIINRNIFKIGDTVTFLNCGEIRYYQTNPNKWNNVISKYKEMGLNAVSVSIPWKYHEKEYNRFDFVSNKRDLDYFLHLCENKGLYIIIKPGPTVDHLINDGIPQWLIENHPKILVLDENQNYLDESSTKKPTGDFIA